jgi:hypothetical protein
MEASCGGHWWNSYNSQDASRPEFIANAKSNDWLLYVMLLDQGLMIYEIITSSQLN